MKNFISLTRKETIYLMASIVFLVLVLFPQEVLAIDTSGLERELQQTRKNFLRIAQIVVSICSIGGGLYAYFKINTDDGGNGKKAIGVFVLALLFGSLLTAIIEVFIPA